MDNNTYLLSLVVPVLNEQTVIVEFLRRTQKVLNELDCSYEIVFVNDGSKDSTLDILKREKTKGRHIKIINLSRNFGHQIAITAGMNYAQGDAVVIIDADLQDPPELIPKMICKWREGYDVVNAKRRRRLGETIFKTGTASVFYSLIRKISNIEIPMDVGDYRLLSRKALNSLKQLPEKHRYIRGLVAWLGYQQTQILYERDRRFAGKTKYPLAKMIRFSMDGLSSFSILPLRVATFLGFLVSFVSFVFIAYALYVKVVLQIAVQGWTTLFIAILFLGGIQLICIGIVGEYIGMIHDEAKGRPLYLVSEIIE